MIVPNSINVHYIKEFKEMILNFLEQNYRFIIVCGGGKTCRNYLLALEEIYNATNDEKDWLGIRATHLNAELIKIIFGEKAFEKIIIDPNEKISTDKKIIIAGGWKPGFSTDMDAVILANLFNSSKVINISNIDYVYSKDPKIYKNAIKYEQLSWEDYLNLIGENWKPGMNSPFDPIASKYAKQNNITVSIIGNNVDNLKKCINEEEFLGTKIS